MLSTRTLRHTAFRAFGLTCLAALVCFGPGCLADEKSADDNRERPDPAYVTLLIARDSEVHDELGLDAKQTASVLAAVAEFDHPLWLLRDVPLERSAEKLAELRKQLLDQLTATLTPEQATRFGQLVVQARGPKALVAPDVQPRLKLSDTQLQQMRELVAASEGGTFDSQKAIGLLSGEQRSVVAALFGKRFDVARVTYVGCTAPELRGVDTWINSQPLSLEELRGSVVAVHFWAFNCSNCINNLPHYQSWFEKFPSGLTIIGIHTPETSAERKVENLRSNIKMRQIEYPVAFDAAAENWKAWGNNVWPAVYLIDKRGNVRAWWYGELNWQGARGEEKMRAKIAELLAEN